MKLQDLASTHLQIPTLGGFKDWLSGQDKPWLLIVENADKRLKEIEDFSSIDNGHIITITTTSESGATEAASPLSYQLTNLISKTDAEKLLKLKAGLARNISCPDQDTIKVCQAIEDGSTIPLLAVHFCAVTILNEVCSIKEYPSHFKKEYKQLMNNQAQPVTASSWDLKIQAAFNILLKQLKRQKPQSMQDALNLLRFASFYTVKPTTFEEYENLLRSLEDVLKRERQTLCSMMLPSKHHIGISDPEGFHYRAFWALLELKHVSFILYDSSENAYTLCPVVGELVKMSGSKDERDEWENIAKKVAGSTTSV
ncbi:hypothetical protein N7456_009689 [Penicillium angulare]|uniref:Uncharacterized protein n=1 Tax=Penicillium angulare TaxID=116970 RepID=A0A9W9F547_9EURO|nr:hypothetical protein N7456_009689 [Penicillium angulare]